MEPTSTANQRIWCSLFFILELALSPMLLGPFLTMPPLLLLLLNADAVSIIYTNETSFRFDFIYILQKWDHFESWFCIKSSNKNTYLCKYFNTKWTCQVNESINKWENEKEKKISTNQRNDNDDVDNRRMIIQLR